MAFIQGEGRSQGTLFPVTLDELIPEDHVCRVIDAFVGRLDVAGLGFERAEAAETGRPGYDPRDLLKLYLYGYLQQIRSSRRLELECQRNVELMWLLGRLCPDHKSIAEFRRVHSDAVAEGGAEVIRGGCRTRAQCGAEGHPGEQRHAQSAADGGSREDGRGRASEDECDRRCRLLQWRTGRSLRGERNPSSCTQQSRDQQSGRRHILR